MTDRPKMEWTDEELRKAWPCNTDGYPLILGTLENTRAYLKNLGAIHPYESREREREAAQMGASLAVDGTAAGYLPSQPMQAVIARRYPSLTPPPPPALRLSTGEWTWEADCSGWTRANTLCNRDGYPSPTVRTASDARALAEWLANYGSEEERK